MENLIVEETVNFIMDKLVELESEERDITNLIAVLYNLFDGEDNLIDAAKQLTDDTIKKLKNLNKSDENTVIKAIHSAILIGFLSERFTRDAMVSNLAEDNDIIFKHEYDTIETFLRRKMKQPLEGKSRNVLAELAKKAGENAKF